MSWILPVGTACVLLVAPGYLLIRAAGVSVPLRGGWAPPLTVVMTVLLTGAFHLLGIPWAPLPAILGMLLMVAVVAAVRRLLPRWDRLDAPQDGAEEHGRAQDCQGRGAWRWALPAGLVAVGFAVVASASRWMGGIDALNGSYDAFFHHSSIAFIREGGDGFLTTALTGIYGEPTFYPVVWADLAALLPFGVVTSANAMMLATLGAIPIAVAAMLATLGAPDRALPVAVAFTAAASTVFLSAPTMALVMGLWPFVHGVLCLPLGLAAAGRVIGQRPGVLTVSRFVFYLAVMLGAAIAHPTNVFSLAIVGILLLFVTGARRVLEGQNPVRGCAEATGALAVAGAMVSFSHIGLAGMHLTPPAGNSSLQVLLDVLVDDPRTSVVQVTGALMIVIWGLAAIGAVVAVRRVELIGMTAAVGALLTVLLGVLTQVPNPLAVALVNPWYGARERIAPLMMCLVLILMCRALVVMAQVARTRRRMRWAVPTAMLLVLTSVAVALVAPGRLPTLGTRSYLGVGMNTVQYVTPLEREFIRRTAAELPADSVVIADPRDGGPVYWFEGGVETVFPTLSQPQTRDSQLLGAYIHVPDDRGLVCGAFERLRPTHLYRDHSEESGHSLYPDSSQPWRGVHDVPATSMRLVDREGPYALYEVRSPC